MPSKVGNGILPGKRNAGLPTTGVWIFLLNFLLIASNPKKVKNNFTSIPSNSAPLAKTKAGYTLSNEPLEQIMHTFF